MTTSFVTAASVEKALAAMVDGARPVAGGTDIVVADRTEKAPLPESLVAIHRVAELTGIETQEDGGIRIGALATHADAVASEDVRTRFTALSDACAIVGSHATRAHGTIGGNLMNASPAMETGGPLLCFGASVTLQSPSGTRWLALDDLWSGPGETTANPDELLVAVDVPSPARGTGSAYVRLEYRRQMEIAVVGATAVITLEEDTVSEARVAMTALAPTIRRVPEAEAALAGSDAGAEAIDAAGAAAAAAAEPISDVRGSAEYRQAMAAVITRRAIELAATRTREGSA